MWWIYPLIVLGIIDIIVLVRTMRFKKKHTVNDKIWHDVDQNHAVQSLSDMLKIKTVSYSDPVLEDSKSFIAFRDYIQNRYPQIMKVATYELIERGMLFKIPGKASDQPIVLMSHYDVVPAQDGWKDNPFSGNITDTHIYGRGALDTKSSLNAIMEAMEHLLTLNKLFSQDIYLAFSGDEEIFGNSAPSIVKTLKERGIKPYLVLDEGGAIVSKMFPGVREKAAVVGIAEKGFMNVRLTATSRGGHASTPPKDTPLTELSKAVVRLNNHPSFSLKMTEPVKALFDTLAPYSKSFGIRMLFSNLWLFMPLIKVIAKLSGGEFLSMFKTTQAFTIAKGSDAINVLPSEASMSINYRLRPGETSSIILDRISHIIKNPHIKIEALAISEATSTSLVDEAFNKVKHAISQTWPHVLVAPYLMVATTDSRHYHEICDHVYKFSPMDVSKEDLKKIHGYDEDISIDNVVHGVNFYICLLNQFVV